MIVGTEWLIEAAGCEPEALRDLQSIRRILDRVIADLGLKVVGDVWHKFPGEGGVTGLVALSESHLACHTYPEHGTATFNLYCCRTRPEWDWEAALKDVLGAAGVFVTKIERGEGGPRSDNRDLESNISDGNQSQIPDLKFEIADSKAGTAGAIA
jgi:S-adenosylmethionine decarboxylase